ncbi:MAG: acyl-CoA/acyl-ACP dehydrogenase [Burkholderiales bacterium]|nr:acyl-CoA/acyl-ACP dehydrogenase [Burkholderiales bacterium]
MDLSPTGEQQLIVDAASAFLAERASSAATRAAMASASGIDASLWREIGAMGWCGVHLGEAIGGMGLGLVELVLLQEQLGRRLACVPYFDSVVRAGTLLVDLLGDADAASVIGTTLAALGCGDLVAGVASLDAEDGAQATATAQPGGWTLDGDWPRVGSAAAADRLLLVARGPGDESLLFLCAPRGAGIEVRPLETIDRTRRVAAVSARAASLPAVACIARGARLDAALARLRCVAAIALAAEQLGSAQQCLDLSAAYLGERVQFDRPLASFQAVKHRCAQMAVAVECARSAVYGAACAAAAAPDDAATLEFEAALARCEATEASQFCAQEAIQLHGGVGYTWDCDAQLHFKRAQASSQRLGATGAWLDAVARRLIDGVPA